MSPMPLLALGSAGASMLGGLMSRPSSPNWGQIGSRYIGQFGGALQNQFNNAYNSGPLSGLTMGAGNAGDYANVAMAQFKKSPAYAAMMNNLMNASNSASQGFQQGLSGGLNTGVGQGLSALGNVNTMFNNNLMNANMQQYLQAQNQFTPLAGMRTQGAMDLTRGAMGMAQQGMSQYQQMPSWAQQTGAGLMGLGNAGFNYLMGQPGGTGAGAVQHPGAMPQGPNLPGVTMPWPMWPR